jgi:hypothetical protein
MCKSQYDSVCIVLKSIKFKSEIKYLPSLVQQSSKVALTVQYVYLLCLFNVDCCNYYSGTSVTLCEVLLINIGIFKLF